MASHLPSEFHKNLPVDSEVDGMGTDIQIGV
jgi:hypothetical protein